ncbi:hypothetical protein [Xaviernesmea rhizosphaerae]|uniref:hypothetical protein n=1 Tax=Xaviernesmea rhizosphaerae TaxID=1672749 RepID=UPI00094F8421|nr:hypothetical protein [Xaviernesmea rhizosphaerae]
MNYANSKSLGEYWPAVLSLQKAASYCGMSVQAFKEACPVRPLKYSLKENDMKFLRNWLDDWLASLN